METNDKPKTKADIYREHVKRAQEFSGSDRQYCVENSLSPGTFYSYKSKLGFTKRKSNAFITVRQVPAPATAPKVAPVKLVTLPDPKWVAELLKYFLASR